MRRIVLNFDNVLSGCFNRRFRKISGVKYYDYLTKHFYELSLKEDLDTYIMEQLS